MSNLKKLEQGRAEQAYKAALDGVKDKDYVSYVKKLPMLIKTNGLAASIVFYAGNKDAHKLICTQILAWLQSDYAKVFVDFTNAKSAIDLAHELTKLESSQYRAVTIEVLAFLNWLKRFTDGLIEKKK
jgi:CRISPR-associated protein Cmr5